MRARLAFIESLQEVNLKELVQIQLDNVMDILLRMNQSDNMGVQDLVPGLMLRLDEDQEVYDPMKWYR